MAVKTAWAKQAGAGARAARSHERRAAGEPGASLGAGEGVARGIAEG